LRQGVDQEQTAWLIVSAGMGTVDFARTQNRWSEVEGRLEQTAQTIIDMISISSSERPGARE
jgi:hypothetical protein